MTFSKYIGFSYVNPGVLKYPSPCIYNLQTLIFTLGKKVNGKDRLIFDRGKCDRKFLVQNGTESCKISPFI